MGQVAPQHVGSSQTRAQTGVPCIGRQTLNHCATREAPLILFYSLYFAIVLSFRLVPTPPSFSFFCCSFILPCCISFDYSFIFPNIFFIFLILFCFLFFDIVLLVYFFLPSFFFYRAMKLVGSWFPGCRSGPSSCGGSSESKPLE